MKVELHLIQNFAPSCLNRDENNMPKDCTFGSVRRARISSQCIKRSVREYWRSRPDVEQGFRTKKLKSRLLPEIKALRPEAEDALLDAATDLFIATYYSKPDSKHADQTAVLLYVGLPELREAAACLNDAWDVVAKVIQHNSSELAKPKDKQKLKALEEDKTVKVRLRQATPSADIALFGRMLAENPDMRVDGSCQVAHAISTHRVDADMDFYTAVDDLNPGDESGAGMMGVVGFNSACFYRYACVDRDDLIRNLAGDTPRADSVIRAFLEASIKAIPTGKQNSMAALNQPSFGMAVVRETGVPMSLANAYAKPVAEFGEGDLVSASIKALTDHWASLTRFYGSDGVLSTPVFIVGNDGPLGELAGCREDSLPAFLTAVSCAIGATAEASR